MPRPALKKVSTTALQAELQRRLDRLPQLLKMKAQVEADLAELQVLAGKFGKAVAVEAPGKPVDKRRRTKAKTIKVAAKPVVVKPVAKRPRKAFKQTAPRFILRLLKAGPMTTAQLNERWSRIGRGGKADKTLGEMVATGTIRREKMKVGKGSEYRLA